jgi:hypothetical protein
VDGGDGDAILADGGEDGASDGASDGARDGGAHDAPGAEALDATLADGPSDTSAPDGPADVAPRDTRGLDAQAADARPAPPLGSGGRGGSDEPAPASVASGCSCRVGAAGGMPDAASVLALGFAAALLTRRRSRRPRR